MPVILDRIPLDKVEAFWPFIESYVEAACAAVSTTLTPDEIRENAKADKRGLWTAVDTDSRLRPFVGVASVGMRETNRGRVFFIEAVGGINSHQWLEPCLAELEEIAKAAGAVKVEVEGRRGWRRVLPGYREVRTVLEKDL
jgi:hypothetical protein